MHINTRTQFELRLSAYSSEAELYLLAAMQWDHGLVASAAAALGYITPTPGTWNSIGCTIMRAMEAAYWQTGHAPAWHDDAMETITHRLQQRGLDDCDWGAPDIFGACEWVQWMPSIAHAD